MELLILKTEDIIVREASGRCNISGSFILYIEDLQEKFIDYYSP